MPNHDPRAIANEFLRRRAQTTWPQQLIIQKLCHIANGWNLAINGKPLVFETPEAWDNGPVFRTIWDHVRDFGYRGDSCTLVNPATKTEFSAFLDHQEVAVIDLVWTKYGNLDAQRLRGLTHEQGSPWEVAYLNRGRNAELDLEDIRNHYVALALAA